MNDAVQVSVQIATGDDEVPPGADWHAWVGAALAGAGIEARDAGCVTLRLVGRSESRHLNEMYRHKTGPTNVLAFAGTGDQPIAAGDRELGDLVVCLPLVHDEAAARGKAARAHLAHLVVHGTLHLAGYDHVEPAAAQRMESLETRVLLGLGFPAPYADDDAPRVDSATNEERADS